MAVDIGIPSMLQSSRPVFRDDIAYHRLKKGIYTVRFFFRGRVRGCAEMVMSCKTTLTKN